MTSDQSPNMFQVDLEDLDFEELLASTDRFTLAILNMIYTPRQIEKLDEQGLARGIAFETCHRYMEAMHALAQRFVELESVKSSLNGLL